MKLGVSRLCLDCDEVHDQERCPVCASEVFAFLTRWVPRSNGRLTHLRPAPEAPEVETYRQITGQQPKNSGRHRMLLRGAVGLGMLGMAGWLWRRASGTQTETSQTAASDTPPTEPQS